MKQIKKESITHRSFLYCPDRGEKYIRPILAAAHKIPDLLGRMKYNFREYVHSMEMPLDPEV